MIAAVGRPFQVRRAAGCFRASRETRSSLGDRGEPGTRQAFD